MERTLCHVELEFLNENIHIERKNSPDRQRKDLKTGSPRAGIVGRKMG